MKQLTLLTLIATILFYMVTFGFELMHPLLPTWGLDRVPLMVLLVTLLYFATDYLKYQLAHSKLAMPKTDHYQPLQIPKSHVVEYLHMSWINLSELVGFLFLFSVLLKRYVIDKMTILTTLEAFLALLIGMILIGVVMYYALEKATLIPKHETPEAHGRALSFENFRLTIVVGEGAVRDWKGSIWFRPTYGEAKRSSLDVDDHVIDDLITQDGIFVESIGVHVTTYHPLRMLPWLVGQGKKDDGKHDEIYQYEEVIIKTLLADYMINSQGYAQENGRLRPSKNVLAGGSIPVSYWDNSDALENLLNEGGYALKTLNIRDEKGVKRPVRGLSYLGGAGWMSLHIILDAAKSDQIVRVTEKIGEIQEKLAELDIERISMEGLTDLETEELHREFGPYAPHMIANRLGMEIPLSANLGIADMLIKGLTDNLDKIIPLLQRAGGRNADITEAAPAIEIMSKLVTVLERVETKLEE